MQLCGWSRRAGTLLVEGGQRAHHADHSAAEGRGVEAIVARVAGGSRVKTSRASIRRIVLVLSCTLCLRLVAGKRGRRLLRDVARRCFANKVPDARQVLLAAVFRADLPTALTSSSVWSLTYFNAMPSTVALFLKNTLLGQGPHQSAAAMRCTTLP